MFHILWTSSLWLLWEERTLAPLMFLYLWVFSLLYRPHRTQRQLFFCRGNILMLSDLDGHVWDEPIRRYIRQQTWHKILKNFEKSKFWTYWYWFWYWKLQFQNIDFDIDIEICISKILILILILNFLWILILILVLILKKEEENIDNLSSEKNTSASLTLGF